MLSLRDSPGFELEPPASPPNVTVSEVEDFQKLPILFLFTE